MRTVEAQLRRVLDAAVRPAPVRVAISEAQGLLCAEEVVADRALPGFDQAAVDGFAVRSVDVRGAADGPVELPVVGEVATGSRTAHRLSPGQAVRVATGAPLPTLADTVVPLDHTGDALTSQRARCSVKHPVPSGGYVRRVGEDVAPGDVAVRRGVVVGAAQVGLLAAVGRTKVLVHPRPRVTVLAIGDELVDVDRTPATGQVPDVGSYALAAAAADAGAQVTRLGIVPGEPAAIREAVEGAVGRSEVVLVTGGVGGRLGEDVRDALSVLGTVDTTRVAMHPGSVQGFGRLAGVGGEEVPTFLLPINPVSALVAFEVLVRPLIRLTLGKPDLHRREVTASLLSPLTSVPGRRSYVRGQLLRDRTSGDYLAQPLGAAGSHLLSSMAEANALIVLDEDVTEAGVDTTVRVAFLAPRS